MVTFRRRGWYLRTYPGTDEAGQGGDRRNDSLSRVLSTFRPSPLSSSPLSSRLLQRGEVIDTNSTADFRFIFNTCTRYSMPSATARGDPASASQERGLERETRWARNKTTAVLLSRAGG